MPNEIVDIGKMKRDTEEAILSIYKNVRALNSANTDITSRINTLEEQMQKRVYVSPLHKNIMQKAVRTHVKALTDKYLINYKDGAKKLFQAVWHSLKDKYSISCYCELPDIEFTNALEFIHTWEDEVILNRLKRESAA